ncbi:dihydrolipoamide acetyltransferase family protein [Nocardioides panaciterrulae]|uniref:Dihydrolipoamide acetyltransferase component of pyruvate dehydrogenase complex n=1 Tax=Nocardioides panaciterrulae TaxID=661492 RepID=A0A7Y9J9C8_9ACTN|nr:dihydrolipoamide acetyltransferase family protein [Nocardioides panaciterrulae]NYD40193.1 pyruvate dehydrogenase E2 component (dihydrolipoamide acetyltransferase) [Nocardioides panaciterrulae]
MPEFKLPDVGEGLTEAEIVSWKVKVGDTIAINDIVVEIETAKSLVELPSPYAGTVTALLVPEGETVPVGTPIIAVGDAAEAAAAPAGPAPAVKGPDTHEPIDTNVPPEGNPTLVGYGPREVAAKRRARKGAASPSTEAGAATQMQVQGAFAPGGARSGEVQESDEPAVPATSARVAEPSERAHALVPERATSPAESRALAKPPVRKLAKDLGIDLATLTPTGPNGTVTRADVEQAASGAGAAPVAPAATGAYAGRGGGQRETREPIKGVRKMMAQAMSQSAFTAPHVTEWITVDVTRTMEFVERLKARREFRDVRVSPLLVLSRAVMLAMKRTPEINSFWDEAAQEVVHKHYVNLGIAAATPRGLVVPNVKDADSLSLLELGQALNQLADVARQGRTQPAEMSGGTFTITNVGVFGVDAGTPIINPGESAILCFGTVRKQPWVVTGADGGDELAIRQLTTLALSFDHRHIDGEKGSRFLADVAGILEDPASALLF